MPVMDNGWLRYDPSDADLLASFFKPMIEAVFAVNHGAPAKMVLNIVEEASIRPMRGSPVCCMGLFRPPEVFESQAFRNALLHLIGHRFRAPLFDAPGAFEKQFETKTSRSKLLERVKSLYHLSMKAVAKKMSVDYTDLNKWKNHRGEKFAKGPSEKSARIEKYLEDFLKANQ